MLRKLIFILLAIFPTAVALSQAKVDSMVINFQKKITLAKQDTSKAGLLIQLATYYTNKAVRAKSDFDKADEALRQAHFLLRRTPAPLLEIACDVAWSDVLGGRNQKNRQVNYLFKAIRESQRLKATSSEAIAWNYLAHVYSAHSRSDEDNGPALIYLKKAREVYKKLSKRDFQTETDLLKETADIHMNQGMYDLAEKELVQVEKEYKRIGYRKLHYTYDLLAGIAELRGNYNKAVYYALAMIKSLRATGDTSWITFFSGRFGRIFNEADQKDMSISFYKRQLRQSEISGEEGIYTALRNITAILFTQKKAGEALRLVKAEYRKVKPVANSIDEYEYIMCMGNCYHALGNFPEAETYYKKVIGHLKNFTPRYSAVDNYLEIGNFYLDYKKYDRAKSYLDTALSFGGVMYPPAQVKNIHLSLFKADSALGKLRTAIPHYQRYVMIKDSIEDLTKSKEIANLTLAYKGAQKDDSIRLLQANGTLQKINLRHAESTRNWIISAALLLLIMLGVVYNRFLLKQRSNKQLETQQVKINRQNSQLQRAVTEKNKLISDKDHLLSDKDLLLKEVHHRVKNNLHIVMSLLESQSAYLDNNAVNEAIMNSQNRVQAIALIHQKLYNSQTITHIGMQDYIPELTDCLNNSINTADQHIVIRYDIEPILLDVSQAIPVGIILNEAVTNALKYAFPKRAKGEVAIFMSRKNNNAFLQIMDNGIGLPANFNFQEVKSLGMNLIRGLTQQLKGSATIINNGGVQISISFRIEKLNAVQAG
jgi:two-component sensor histidine kinase